MGENLILRELYSQRDSEENGSSIANEKNREEDPEIREGGNQPPETKKLLTKVGGVKVGGFKKLECKSSCAEEVSRGKGPL